MRQELKDLETKQFMETKNMKERFDTEKEQLRSEINRLSEELFHAQQVSPQMVMGDCLKC